MEKLQNYAREKSHYIINNCDKSQDNNDNKIKSLYTNILTLHILFS